MEIKIGQKWVMRGRPELFLVILSTTYKDRQWGDTLYVQSEMGNSYPFNTTTILLHYYLDEASIIDEVLNKYNSES